VVTLCTEGQGATAPALLGGAEEPLLDGHLACQVWRAATHSLWRAPCVAAVAMAPLALILVVRLPSAVMSSTARAHRPSAAALLWQGGGLL
jgi:hypothetical protein